MRSGKPRRRLEDPAEHRHTTGMVLHVATVPATSLHCLGPLAGTCLLPKGRSLAAKGETYRAKSRPGNSMCKGGNGPCSAGQSIAPRKGQPPGPRREGLHSAVGEALPRNRETGGGCEWLRRGRTPRPAPQSTDAGNAQEKQASRLKKHQNCAHSKQNGMQPLRPILPNQEPTWPAWDKGPEH